VGSTFEVMAEPNRRVIVELLRDRERTVGELVQKLDVSQPAVSKHLRVLREVGLVESRIDAQRRVYRMRSQPLRELDAWLEPYRAMWTRSLEALERHLDEADKRPQGGKHDRRARKKR